jgi:hypothetical protein
MPRGRSGLALSSGFCFRSTNSERLALGGVKGAGDLGRNFNLALNPAAGDQRGVQPGKDFRQRQRNQHTIAIVLCAEYIRGGLAQIAKIDLNGAASQLRQNLLERDGDCEVAYIGLLNPGL